MSELQLFKPLPSYIEDALRASIKRFGVLVPVVKDQHGRTLDGHHRSRIAAELGVKYKVDVRSVADDDEAREVARTLNSDRRHLTEEERKAVVRALAGETVAAGKGGREEVARYSPEAIAGALGVSDTTVRDDIRQLESTSQLTRPAKTIGRDGKIRPSRRPASEKAQEKEATPKPSTRKASRGPLPVFAKTAGWSLRREVEKLERIYADDRFNQYRDQVTAQLHGHLTYAVETLSRLLDQHNTTGGE